MDVGCSTGALGAAFRELKHCKVVGIDIDPSDIKQAQKNLDRALIMDVNDPKLQSLGKFDSIIFADVLEHLADPRATLRNIKRMLSKKGKVIFSLPHMAHMSVRLDLLSGVFPYKNVGLLDKTHLHFYDRREVESIFLDAGYSIERMNPVLSEYPAELIKEKLEKVGLNSTDEFVTYLKRTSGQIFQFVGEAVPSVIAKVVQDSKYIMPQDETRQYADSILVENRRLREEEEELKKQLYLARAELTSQVEKMIQLQRTPIRTAVHLIFHKFKDKLSGHQRSNPKKDKDA